MCLFNFAANSSVENILIYGTCDQRVTSVVLYYNYYVQYLSFSFVTNFSVYVLNGATGSFWLITHCGSYS